MTLTGSMAARGSCLPLSVALLAAVACTARPAVDRPALPVRVAAVEFRVQDASARYSANVEPLVRVDLAFKVGGYIEEVLQVRGPDGRVRLVQDGDTVRQGTVLARIRDADYQVRLAQARGGVAQAEAALGAARQDFDRATALMKDQAIPQAVMDGAKSKLDGTQGAVDLARAMLRQAQLAVGDTALKSPIDGVVLKRLVEVGSLVGPGSGGFVLADVSSVKAVLGVPDSGLGMFPVDAKVPVRVEALGVVREGHVTRVSPYADPRTRVFDVEVTLPNSDGVLKPGMVASAAAPEGPAGRVATVPVQAVRRPPGSTEGYAVFVVEESAGRTVARVRKVRIGEIRGSSIEVPEGVREGERVIVSGATLAVDGGAVAVIP